MAVNNRTPPGEIEDPSPDTVPLSPRTSRQSGRGSRSFDEFYRREFRQVLTLAQSLTGSWVSAEDVAQDAFAAVAMDWSHVETLTNPSTWTRRIVINKCSSWHRRRTRESRALRLWTAGRRDVTEITWSEGFWEDVRALPRRQAACVALYYLEDRTMADIAEVLSCSEATVRVHLFKGRQALAAKLLSRGLD